MERQINSSLPDGLMVIHPARRDTSAAARRIARERLHRQQHVAHGAHSRGIAFSSEHPDGLARSERVRVKGNRGIASLVGYVRARLSGASMFWLGLPVLTVAALMVLGAISLLAPQSAKASSERVASVTEVVTVNSGQTLWDIAHDIDPQADPRDTIARIIELNDLPTTKVQAGQRLEVPAS